MGGMIIALLRCVLVGVGVGVLVGVGVGGFIRYY